MEGSVHDGRSSDIYNVMTRIKMMIIIRTRRKGREEGTENDRKEGEMKEDRRKRRINKMGKAGWEEG